MDRRKTDRRRAEHGSDIFIPDLFDILRIFVKRKKLIALMIAVPVVLGLIYLETRPDNYVATASVILEDQNVNVAEFQDLLAGMKFDNLTVPTQVRVISSPDLMRETVTRMGIYLADRKRLAIDPQHYVDENGDKTDAGYDVLKQFGKSLSVRQQGTSRIIEISFSSPDPELSATIANAHTKQYVYSLTQIKRQQAENLDARLSKQIVDLKEETIRKSRAVQSFRVESGMVLGRNSQELVYQQISDIAAQLTPIETRELDLKARMDVLSGGNAESIVEVVDSKLIQDLKSRLSVASQKLQSMQSDFGQNHPDIVSTQREISQIKSDIQREILSIQRSIGNELQTVSKQKEMLNDKLAELQKQADSFEEKQITLQSLQREESASRKQLDTLLERSEEIKSRLDYSRPDVRIVSLATPPGEPSNGKKPILLIAIIMLSAFAAIAVTFGLEIIDRGIDRKDDVKKILNLKLLGTLPKEKDPVGRVTDKSRSAYLEEIKRIYVHLSSNPATRSVLFTSSDRGEGKSTVLVSLATYLNSIGKKTLIIDADAINPRLADFFLMKSKPGFYELLNGSVTLKDVIVRDKNGVCVIPSGERNSQISDLLLAGHLQEHLEKILPKFDYVLIDSAPATHATDVEVLAGLVDQVILVTEWAKTPRKKIKLAGEMIRQFSRDVPHIVLNKVDPKDV